MSSVDLMPRTCHGRGHNAVSSGRGGRGRVGRTGRWGGLSREVAVRVTQGGVAARVTEFRPGVRALYWR